MSNELTGRALDEAAAVAMGWTKPSTRGRCDVCGWPIVPDGEQGCWASNCSMRYRDSNPVRADQCADYSTDPATIPELLAWLRGQDCFALHFTTHKDADWDWCAESDCGRVLPFIYGTTLNEALARLVVAVAAARSKP